MENLPVIIQVSSLVITLGTQAFLLAYAWGKISEKVDGLKEDRNEIMAALKDTGHAVNKLADKVQKHGQDIEVLKAITSHRARNGSNG